MTAPDRDRLVARIRQLSRRLTPADTPGARGPARTDDHRLEMLEARIEHLEQLVEGLQDSVHRESHRQEELIADLHARVQPAAVRAALSRDARDRGL